MAARVIVLAFCLASSGAMALAFTPSNPQAFASPGLRGASRAGLRGVGCRGSGGAGRGPAATSAEGAPALGRRQLLGAALGAAAALLLPADAAWAKKKKEEPTADPAAPAVPTISLADFYTALYAQEVESVEFDGPEFDRAYVKFSGGKNSGKTLLIGEGYPKESPVNSSGPQQVLAKIRNEIKAGNPVTWSWKGASSFKKQKPAAETSDGKEEKKPSDGKDDKGEKKGEAAKGEAANGDKKEEGGKEDKKEEKKGGFPFSFAPPKSL